MQLQNGSETLAVAAAATAFTFATELADLSTYSVSVSTQPTGQTCSVTGGDNNLGAGTIAGADVTNVAVACVDDSVIPPPTTPITSYTGALPSGATGTLNFTSTDAACTFATPPQFLDTVTPAPPASILLVDGGISFTVSGCTPGATVTLTMDYGVALPVGSNFWKAGTPWYRLPATVAGTTVIFSITDGGLGDTDGLVNGEIVDPSGVATDVVAPVPSPVAPIPTQSEWALMILSMLLGLIVFANRRRLF